MAFRKLQTNKELPRFQQTQQVQQEPEKISFKETPGKYALSTIGNIPESGIGVAKAIGTAITQPVETIKGLGRLGAGGVQKLIPGEQEQEKYFNAFTGFLKERYGSMEQLEDTIRTDPVGFALDASIVLGGTGAAIRGAGTATKVSQLTKAGQMVSKAGKAIEPIRATAKVAGVASRPFRKIGKTIFSESLGVSTGAGGEAIRTAFRSAPTKEYVQALRGKTIGYNIINVAREGLNKLKDNRAKAYLAKSKEITTSKQKISLIPIQLELNKQLKNYGVIRKTHKGKKTLDFSRSTIDPTEATRIKGVVQAVDSWGKRIGDNTPKGFDILKRKLDDFYTPSKEGTGLVMAVRRQVKNSLDKNVKGYSEMTKDYAKASEQITEIQKSLSLKPGIMPEQTLNKFTAALKADKEIRQGLIKAIDDVTGSNIEAMVAGTLLHPGVPSGIVGRGIWAGAGGAGIAQATGLISSLFSPLVFSGLAFSSPRIVGELLRAIGLPTSVISQVIKNLANRGFFKAGAVGEQAGFQAGRIQKEVIPD